MQSCTQTRPVTYISISKTAYPGSGMAPRCVCDCGTACDLSCSSSGCWRADWPPQHLWSATLGTPGEQWDIFIVFLVTLPAFVFYLLALCLTLLKYLLAVLQDALFGADTALCAGGVSLPFATLHIDVHVELSTEHGHLGLGLHTHRVITRHLRQGEGEDINEDCLYQTGISIT